MYVRDHMSSTPVTVGEGVPLAEAARIQREKGFRHLPVTGPGGQLVGIISDRDLRPFLPTSLDGEEDRARIMKRLQRTTVGEVMTREPRSVPLGATLDDALYLLEGLRIGALPVVDADGAVAGVFSVQDLMAAYRQLFGLGEEGSAFLEIADDGREDLVSGVAGVLERKGIAMTRMIRRRGGEGRDHALFLRVSTYNIHGLCEALGRAGFRCRGVGTRPSRDT